MSETSVGGKHWIWTNDRIRKLSYACKDLLLEFAKDDVRVCIENNGIHDPICQRMAEDVNEMEEYLLG